MSLEEKVLFIRYVFDLYAADKTPTDKQILNALRMFNEERSHGV